MATKWKKSKYPNLYRREPSGTYYIRVQAHGKVISKSLKTKGLKEARVLAMSFLSDVLKKPAGNKAVAMSYRDAFEAVDRFYESESLVRATTARTARCMARRLIELWTLDLDESISTLTESKARAFLASMLKKYSRDYVRSLFVVLRKAVSIGIEAGLLDEDPTAKLKVPSPPPRSKEIPNSEKIEELFQKMLEQDDPRLIPVVQTLRFLVYGGFRWSESRLIVWSDIEGGCIRVHRETKSGKQRTVPIIEQMAKLLDELRSEAPRNPGEHIVRADYKLCLRALVWGCGEIGIRKMTPHDMRHVFTTSCLDSGVDIPTVSAWLGHQDGGVLVGKVYGHRRNEHMENMAKKVRV